VAQAKLSREDDHVTVDARDVYYRQLNETLRGLVQDGVGHIRLEHVFGQRYIGTNLARPVDIEIDGIPGNDLGAFMDGPRIEVHGNAQDGTGNTMNSGRIVVHGNAGDITAMSMRGGAIFIRGDVGYRTAIHMKEYRDKVPLLVIGGTAQDFFGEYMAGGMVVLLGLDLAAGEFHRASFIGTGMHGGAIYIRGEVQDYQLGKEVGVQGVEGEDRRRLEEAVRSFADHFDLDAAGILAGNFRKLYPKYLRPYGTHYAY
jgi:glutamate synthase domain-containing protein 3